MENPKHGDAGWIIHRKFVPETSTQPGFCFSILLFSSVGTLQFPICSQTFTSVSSVEIEHSRSAWSTVFSQCRVCSSDCYNVKNEMDFAMPQKSHRYCLSLKAHIISHKNMYFRYIAEQFSKAKVWGVGPWHRLLTCCTRERQSWVQNCHPSPPWALLFHTKCSWSDTPYACGKSTLILLLCSTRKAIWIFDLFA